MEDTFDLEAVNDNGVIYINDYEKCLEIAKNIVNTYNIESITDDSDKKYAKEIGARYNKVIDVIKRVRIDTIKDLTSKFEEQCKTLSAILESREKELGSMIKEYEAKVKEEAGSVAVKKVTATIKFSDNEKTRKLITDFCTKHSLELNFK